MVLVVVVMIKAAAPIDVQSLWTNALTESTGSVSSPGEHVFQVIAMMSSHRKTILKDAPYTAAGQQALLCALFGCPCTQLHDSQ
jgi:hypothetical protein